MPVYISALLRLKLFCSNCLFICEHDVLHTIRQFELEFIEGFICPCEQLKRMPGDWRRWASRDDRFVVS